MRHRNYGALDRYTLVDDKYKKEEAQRSDAIAERLVDLYQNTYSVKHLYQRHNKKLLDNLARDAELAQGRLLEIGCGFGNFLADACRIVKEVQGVDIGERNIEMARAILPSQVMVQIADAESLPFQGKMYNYVVLKGVLHHLGKPGCVLREAYRILRPGGKIAIYEGDPTAPYRRIVLGIADLLGVSHETTLFRHLTPNEIVSLLVKTGFNEIYKTSISGLFVPIGLRGKGNQCLWKMFDAVEDWLEHCTPSLFRWYNLYEGCKPNIEKK